MEDNTFTVDGFTWICCGVIAVAFIAAWMYVADTDSKEFTKRKKWIDQLPSIISTLGVLGTFLGITRGLMSFDTDHLDSSIPVLLGGLKTAFFTSLSGMFGSLILNRIVSHKFDVETVESEEIKAAKLIIDELRKEKTDLTSLLNKNQTDLVKALGENATIKGIRQDVEQLKDDLEEIKGHAEELKESVGAITENVEKVVSHNEQIEALSKAIVEEMEGLKTLTGSNSDEISKVRAVLVTATASISSIDNHVEELNTTLSGIDTTIVEISEGINEIQDHLEPEENV